MHIQNIEGMFQFDYVKSSAEIIEKMNLKIAALNAKVEQRKARIQRLRAEHAITDAVYIDLLEQARDLRNRNDGRKMSYSVSNNVSGRGLNEEEFVIGAGVVNHLLTEADFMKNEESQVVRLTRITRNLKDKDVWISGVGMHKEGHELSEQELEFLGF